MNVDRVQAAGWFALLAAGIASDCGLPWWRPWPIGDVFDITISSFLAVYFLIGALRYEEEK